MASLDRLDALVFTGGVAEHQPALLAELRTAGDRKFERLFTAGADVVFAFHGYPGWCTSCCTGDPGRFHVRGYTEQGSTTTPFDMVVLNRMSRCHLVLEALRRSARVPEGGAAPARHCDAMPGRHHGYIREHFEDMPEIRGRTWAG